MKRYQIVNRRINNRAVAWSAKLLPNPRIHIHGVSTTLLIVLSLSLLLSAVLVRSTLASTTAVIRVCPSVDCDYLLIQEAVDAATDGDTIQVLTIPVHTEAGIIVNKDITIEGAGMTTTFIQAADSVNNASARVFHIKSGAEVTIRDLTIRFGNGIGDKGGGIFNEGDRFILRNVQIRQNEASLGGGIYNAGGLTIIASRIHSNRSQSTGGGIYNAAVLAMEDSQVNNNYAIGSGGGLFNVGSAVLDATSIDTNTSSANSSLSGGGIFNQNNATLSLSHSSVNGNTVTQNSSEIYFSAAGGGISNIGTMTIRNSSIDSNTVQSANDSKDGGGIYVGSGNVEIENSTIEGNVSYLGGGMMIGSTAIVNLHNSTVNGNTGVDAGGGIYLHGQDMNLTNVTVSGNKTNRHGGGLYVSSVGSVNLSNTTISTNIADLDANGSGQGGGIYNNSGSVLMKNTILSGNQDLSVGIFTRAPDCSGSLASAGYNLIGALGLAINGTYCTITGDETGNLSGLADLEPLADNGGPTQTHALLSGSQAINAGDPAGCYDFNNALLDRDQRGGLRIDRCDMGAFELGALTERLFLPVLH